MRISDWSSDVCSSDLDIDGRRRLLVGGTVNSYIANPTFDPVAKPGSLFDWYRGNPKQQQITEAFGELEPLRPEYQDREVRLKVMEEQGLAGMRSEEHTSELQSLMRNSYTAFYLTTNTR